MPDTAVALDERSAALDRYAQTPSGRERPGRYWKINLETLEIPATDSSKVLGTVEIVAPPRVTAVPLTVAKADHAALLARAYARAIEPQHKFSHLTIANAGLGAFVYIPADVAIDDPIVITYRTGEDAAIFPHTVVLAERGARATIIERIETGASAFVCGISEIVTEAHADVTYAAPQTLPGDARILFTRAAKPGANARVSFATAELGAALSVSDIAIAIEEPGIDANVATLFFPNGIQHVDVVNAIDHRAGHSVSNTVVRSAATGHGQARYLGNIRIAPQAQGSNASLRDDALLLSEHAHIDSIPALEISANDVKAFHGATVGALDEDALFYMTSRGIEREEAERMIALGFFEPVIDRFPTQALREELQTLLQGKVQ